MRLLTLLAAIGQSDNSFTILQLATAYHTELKQKELELYAENLLSK